MKMQSLIVAAGIAMATASIASQMVPEIAYDANADALTLPANTYLGEVAGVATNSRGHVFVYTRTGHAVATLGDERTFYHGGSRLFQFDQNGKFVKEIGQGVYAINFAQQPASVLVRLPGHRDGPSRVRLRKARDDGARCR